MYHAERLNHTTWDCKYHLIWIPKYRRKLFYGHLRKYLGEVFPDLSLRKESRVVEGHLMPDHVHMLRSIPPKYSVAQVVGFIKGKSAIHNSARTFSGHKKNFTGQHFWARGYYVPTVGKDERAVREYIKTQEAEDLRLDQLEVATSRWVVVITALSGSHFQASGFAGGMVTSKTAMGVNGSLYPDLAKKDTTPNKLHRWKDIPACP